MRHDVVNDAISSLKNAERIGKHEVSVGGTSKLLVSALKVLQEEGYIGEFEVVSGKEGGKVTVDLIKQINDCGVVKPRFSIKHNEFAKWEKRFLPSRDFGLLIVSTPKGLMSHRKAKEQELGGRLIAYVY